MSDYHQIAEDMGIPFGFNLLFDKNIAQLTIERLSAENIRLRLQVAELQAKIDRLIDQADEGDEI